MVKIEVSCVECGNKRTISKRGKKIPLRCKSCACRATNTGRKHSAETNKRNSERNSGTGNHFYGRNHSGETKSKIGKYERTKEAKNIARELLQLVSNRKSFYQCWVEKYGIEIAEQKMSELKLLQSKNNSGKNNSMYGKPPPIGAGNGWSGWFFGFYFRSFLELSYLNFMRKNLIKFESAENKKYAIEYCLDGKVKNYFCDYLLTETNTYVEIKPYALINLPINVIKFSAAREKLKNNFKVITEKDFDKISDSDVMKLYQNGDIEWTKKYEQLYAEKYVKKITRVDSSKGVTLAQVNQH